MANETVTVACKIPNGLRLRLYKEMIKSEVVVGGGVREVKQFFPDPNVKEVVLQGFSHPQNVQPATAIIGGYALTYNVDKQFFDAWMAQNKDAPYVKQGLVFADVKDANVHAQAKEKASIVSGYERLNKDKPLARGIKTATTKDL